MHSHEVAIEDAGVLHALAHHLQQVVRTRLEKARVDLHVINDMFLRQNGAASRHAPDERQTQLLAERIAQPDAARSARDQLDAALALKSAQVLFRRVRRAEPQLPRNFCARGWHAGFNHGLAYEVQDLRLAWCEIRHTCNYIQFTRLRKRCAQVADSLVKA